MKVLELIQALQKLPPNANVTMTENIVNKYDEFTGIEWDIEPIVFSHLNGDCLICCPDHADEVSRAWHFGETKERSYILGYTRIA